ncbi:hypothetical protein BO221_13520 [Archangium sp. Cb G35]|uniref:hypothetical protein n=1 Tax=Archangium sp. Cb G35 TaxID=1920190 RepID=UPI0009378B46|nr:hypothetical protein [Archangium sp. Cb G35]OJT24199.1 hypothetical protein BO221_13520 [Archangium sp. Cb G35]
MKRGVTLIEMLVVGLLLFLLLGAAAVLTQRFVAPSYRPLVWSLGLLLLGAYLGVFAVGLRQLNRTASAWAESMRRVRDFERVCAGFALALPEEGEWCSKRGLLGDEAALTPEARERLVHAAERFERVLAEHPAFKGVASAPGEIIMRRRGDHWRLLWRGEEGEERIHSEGPLSETTPGSA